VEFCGEDEVNKVVLPRYRVEGRCGGAINSLASPFTTRLSNIAHRCHLESLATKLHQLKTLSPPRSSVHIGVVSDASADVRLSIQASAESRQMRNQMAVE
jgi:hypothetical protein